MFALFLCCFFVKFGAPPNLNIPTRSYPTRRSSKLQLANVRPHLLCTVAPPDGDVDSHADGVLRDHCLQTAHLRHLAAVELEDDVTLLDAGILRRPAFSDRRHQGAARAIEAPALGELVGDVLEDRKIVV